MPRRYRSKAAAASGKAPHPPAQAAARGAARRESLEASLRHLSLPHAGRAAPPQRHRADLAASMARLAVADPPEDTAFEDALRARQARTYHDNTVYHGMGCAVCRNRLWTGTLPSSSLLRPKGALPGRTFCARTGD